MKLEILLKDLWSKTTLNKKIKEASESLKIDFKEDVSLGSIQTALLFLVEKSRGKAKIKIEDLINKIMNNEIDENSIIFQDEAKEESQFKIPKNSKEQEEEDKKMIFDILNEMHIYIENEKQKKKKK